jgi:GTP-binding protein
MAAHLAQFPPAYAERNEALLTWPVPEVDPNVFTIEPEAAGYRVRGKRIERLISMTNFAQPESIMRVQRVMEASGINAALRSAGAQEGDTVYIEKAALTWSDEEEVWHR